MHHPHTARFPRFTFTLLLCSLIWYGLGRGSFADNLTASSDIPRVLFEDTNTVVNPDWTISAEQTGFEVIEKSLASPFRIYANAPTFSLVVQNTGNVGLGTSIPEQELHLKYGSGKGGIRLEQDTSLGASRAQI